MDSELLLKGRGQAPAPVRQSRPGAASGSIVMAAPVPSHAAGSGMRSRRTTTALVFALLMASFPPSVVSQAFTRTSYMCDLGAVPTTHPTSSCIVSGCAALEVRCHASHAWRKATSMLRLWQHRLLTMRSFCWEASRGAHVAETGHLTCPASHGHLITYHPHVCAGPAGASCGLALPATKLYLRRIGYTPPLCSLLR